MRHSASKHPVQLADSFHEMTPVKSTKDFRMLAGSDLNGYEHELSPQTNEVVEKEEEFYVTLRRGPTGLDMKTANSDKGVHRVVSVTPSGVADQGGIRAGDILLEANERKLSTLNREQAEAIILAYRKVNLLVMRKSNVALSPSGYHYRSNSVNNEASPSNQSTFGRFGIGALSASFKSRPVYASHIESRNSDGAIGFTIREESSRIIVDTVFGENSRMKPGDVLQAIDSQKVDARTVNYYLSKCGQTFEMEYVRYYKE